MTIKLYQYANRGDYSEKWWSARDPKEVTQRLYVDHVDTGFFELPVPWIHAAINPDKREILIRSMIFESIMGLTGYLAMEYDIPVIIDQFCISHNLIRRIHNED